MIKIIQIEPERSLYKDAVCTEGRLLAVYMKNSVAQIMTESAHEFFGDDAAKIARFLSRLGCDAPYWIDIDDHCIRQVERNPDKGFLSFADAGIEAIADEFFNADRRETQEFLVKNHLFPASYFEDWHDPTGGLIGDLESYQQVKNFAGLLEDLKKRLSERNLIAIKGSAALADKFLGIFFTHYWPESAKKIRALPGSTPIDLYDVLIGALSDKGLEPYTSLRTLRKDFERARAGSQPPIFIVSQVIHCSNQVIDEIESLTSGGKAIFILINPFEKQFSRLKKMGIQEFDLSLEMRHFKGIDSSFLNKIENAELTTDTLDLIPPKTPLVFIEENSETDRTVDFDKLAE